MKIKIRNDPLPLKDEACRKKSKKREWKIQNYILSMAPRSRSFKDYIFETQQKGLNSEYLSCNSGYFHFLRNNIPYGAVSLGDYWNFGFQTFL